MSPRTTWSPALDAAVAAAAGHRRRRAAARRLARAAWLAGAVALAVALAGRMAGWSWAVPALVLVAGAALVAAGAWIARRGRAVSQHDAAAMDEAAALGGELGSAYWFAGARPPDAWTSFHVDRAAVRVAGVNWADVYPPARTRRPWAFAGVLALAALVATTGVPGVFGPRAAPVPAEAEVVRAALAAADELPPDLRRRLEALLAGLTEARVSPDEARATLAELADLLARIDPDLQAKLTDLARRADEQAAASPPGGEGLPESGPREPNAAAGLPEDVRWSIDDLAQRLAQSDPSQRRTEAGNPSATSETGEMGRGSDQAETTSLAGTQPGQQVLREAAGEAGAAQVMLAGGGMGGDSQAGAGGNDGGRGGRPGDLLDLTGALRREVVEASADLPGSDVDTDIRRRTEQGRSTLGFSRAVPAGAVDRSRAVPPPPVPEARRAFVYRVFIRHP